MPVKRGPKKRRRKAGRRTAPPIQHTPDALREHRELQFLRAAGQRLPADYQRERARKLNELDG